MAGVPKNAVCKPKTILAASSFSENDVHISQANASMLPHYDYSKK